MANVSMVFGRFFLMTATVESDDKLVHAGVKSELQRRVCNKVVKDLELPEGKRDFPGFDQNIANVIEATCERVCPEWKVEVSEHVPGEVLTKEEMARKQEEALRLIMESAPGLSREIAKTILAAQKNARKRK